MHILDKYTGVGKLAKRKPKFAPANMAVTPTFGTRVTVLCKSVAFNGGGRRTGEIVATNQGLLGDMFVIRFDAGYCESFRENDLRIGEVQLITAYPDRMGVPA
jgi:hypothetical protein